MTAKNKPAAKRIAALKQKKTGNTPAPEHELIQLNSELTDWCDKSDILSGLKIKDGALKNWRKKNIIVWSKLNGRIFYHKPSLIKQLEDNRRGKV